MLYFAVPADIKRLEVLKCGRVLRGPVMMTPAEFDRAMQEESDRGILRRWRTWRRIANPDQGQHLGIGFKTTELNRTAEGVARHGLFGSKKSYAMEIAPKAVIMLSEISSLEPLHGFIQRENRVVPGSSGWRRNARNSRTC